MATGANGHRLQLVQKHAVEVALTELAPAQIPQQAPGGDRVRVQELKPEPAEYKSVPVSLSKV